MLFKSSPSFHVGRYMTKPKGKKSFNKGRKGNRRPTARGGTNGTGSLNPRYGDIPRAQPSNQAPSLFLGYAESGITEQSEESYQDSLLVCKNIIDLDTPGGANVFQIKFLEPIVDGYFVRTGGDKLDSTARQNWFDRVIKAIDLITNLRIKWQMTYLHPTITRSDTDYKYPFEYTTWENLMATIEANNIMVPVLAYNIANILTIAYQFGSSIGSQRKRPSYLLPFSPSRALSGSTPGTTYPATLRYATNIVGLMHALIAEYDSKLFTTQAILPSVRLTRALIEKLIIFSPVSNVGDVLGATIPCRNDASTYTPLCDATEDIEWSQQYGAPPDLLALIALFRSYLSANGGIVQCLAPGAGNINILQYSFTDDPSTGSEIIDTAKAFAPFTLINSALTQDDATTNYKIMHQFRKVENVLASADLWNTNLVGFFLKYNCINVPLALNYKGLENVTDYQQSGSAVVRGVTVASTTPVPAAANEGASEARAMMQEFVNKTAGPFSGMMTIPTDEALARAGQIQAGQTVMRKTMKDKAGIFGGLL